MKTLGTRQRMGLVAATAALAVGSLGMGTGVAAAPGPAAPTFPDIDPERRLSHFLCYRGRMGGFRSEEERPEIGLRHPLMESRFEVGRGRAFCNPVAKRKGRRLLSPIVSHRQHLKRYQLVHEGAFKVEQILVQNQLMDGVELSIGAPSQLLVPTRKFPHAFPKGLSHFTCHDVFATPDVAAQFKLRDQFRRYKRMKVGLPTAVCIASEKAHDGRRFEPKRPDLHLVCHEVSERNVRFARRASNQFEKRKRFVAKRTETLCVPSLLIYLG